MIGGSGSTGSSGIGAKVAPGPATDRLSFDRYVEELPRRGEDEPHSRARGRPDRRAIFVKRLSGLFRRATRVTATDGPTPQGLSERQLVWIFGSGRTGSTWLARMLSELPGGALWDEPLIGQLFGEFYFLQHPHRRTRNFLLGDSQRDLWLGWIRRMALEGAATRHPGLAEDGFVVVKEPHGTIGAPLVSAALPASRLIMLVRDPRDVVASAADAYGGWAKDRSRAKRIAQGEQGPEGQADIRPTLAERDPISFARKRAKLIARDFQKALQAYERHSGPKTFVRYEDLRAEPAAELERMCRELEVTAPSGALTDAIQRHDWDSLPEELKGEGKVFRKATPGGWHEDLTPRQVRAVEKLTADALDAYYSGWRSSQAGRPPDIPSPTSPSDRRGA